MPSKRSDEPQSVNRRRFLGASVSTAAIPFVGKSFDEARAEPLVPANTEGPLSIALSINGAAYRLGLDIRTTLLDAMAGRRRSPTRFTTRPANACATCRCGSTALFPESENDAVVGLTARAGSYIST
jgi:hypothetical protein